MLFTNNIHIYFSANVDVRILYTYIIHTVDTYMTAVCINVQMIMFNVYITALACFDGYARAATLITDSSCTDCRQITDSSYSDY